VARLESTFHLSAVWLRIGRGQARAGAFLPTIAGTAVEGFTTSGEPQFTWAWRLDNDWRMATATGSDAESVPTVQSPVRGPDAPVDDPATSAARHLDWALVLSVLDPVATAILLTLLEGTALALLVPRLKRGRTSLHNDQKRLGALVCERLGQDILQDAQRRPAWSNDLWRCLAS
jgi:hypothetical protein